MCTRDLPHTAEAIVVGLVVLTLSCIHRPVGEAMSAPSQPLGHFNSAAHPTIMSMKPVLVQVTGEAVYTDDLPPTAGLLHAALVKSARPHAHILSLDTSLALEVRPGPVPMPGRAQAPKPLQCSHAECLMCRLRQHITATLPWAYSILTASGSFCRGAADCSWPRVCLPSCTCSMCRYEDHLLQTV